MSNISEYKPAPNAVVGGRNILPGMKGKSLLRIIKNILMYVF
jgi:hypothetical protein